MKKHLEESKPQNDRGSAIVLVLIFIAVVMVVLLSSVVYRVRESRAREASQSRLAESWEAKGNATVLDRVIKVRLPQQYERDLSFARNCLSAPSDSITPFDEANVTLADSRPAAITGEDPNASTCGDASVFTSLLGNVNSFLKTRINYLHGEAAAIGFPDNKVRISSIKEAVRRFSPDAAPVYQVHFIVDARGGRMGRFRQEGDVFLGNASLLCGTTAEMRAEPQIIQRGQNVNLVIDYSMATNLKIYELTTNTLIHEENVTESPNLQTFVFTFAPTATNSYRVDAVGATAGCASQSAAVLVTVNEPLCTTSPPSIVQFASSATDVTAGDSVVLSWQTSGAISQVLLNGTPVANNNPNYPVVITADTAFTLQAVDDDPVNDCSKQQTITVRVRPPCAFVAPTINFAPDNASIQTGQTVNLGWNVGGLEAGAQIIFIDADGSSSPVGASGTTARTLNTPGTYTYRIRAKNICPDGTEFPAEQTVTVTVSSCPIPVINSFTVNPPSVYIGGNQNITFNWNVSGSIDAQSIDQGVGAVSGNTRTVGQPQNTTTYTYTVVGCGTTRSASVSVTAIGNGGGCTPDGQNRIRRYQRYYSGQTVCRRGTCSVRTAGAGINGYLYGDGRFEFTADVNGDVVPVLQALPGEDKPPAPEDMKFG